MSAATSPNTLLQLEYEMSPKFLHVGARLQIGGCWQLTGYSTLTEWMEQSQLKGSFQEVEKEEVGFD